MQYLGVGEYDIRPYADAIHARHYFQLTTDSSDLPERWEAYEDNDGVSERIRFELYWIPLEKAHVLGAGQGAFIGRVVDDSGSK